MDQSRKAHNSIEYTPMQDPWSRIVCCESNGDIVRAAPGTDGITPNWIGIVVLATTSNSNNIKGVLFNVISYMHNSQ